MKASSLGGEEYDTWCFPLTWQRSECCLSAMIEMRF